MSEDRTGGDGGMKKEIKLLFFTGCAFLIALLVIAVFKDDLEGPRFLIIRVVLALAAAAFAAALPGAFKIKVGKGLTAGGALGVFVFVFLGTGQGQVPPEPSAAESVTLYTATPEKRGTGFRVAIGFKVVSPVDGAVTHVEIDSDDKFEAPLVLREAVSAGVSSHTFEIKTQDEFVHARMIVSAPQHQEVKSDSMTVKLL